MRLPPECRACTQSSAVSQQNKCIERKNTLESRKTSQGRRTKTCNHLCIQESKQKKYQTKSDWMMEKAQTGNQTDKQTHKQRTSNRWATKQTDTSKSCCSIIRQFHMHNTPTVHITPHANNVVRANRQQTSKQTNRQANRQSNRQASKQAGRQAGRRAGRQTDRQAGRLGRQPRQTS